MEEIKEILIQLEPILTFCLPFILIGTIGNLFMKGLRGGTFDHFITEDTEKEKTQEEIDKIIYEGLEQYASAEIKEEDPELIQEFSNKKLYIEL